MDKDAAQREKEFVALIENYQRVIYKVCYIYSGDNEPLSDLYQEVVVNLWKSFPSFRNDCRVSTWVYRIALNTCISFFRKVRSSPAMVSLTAATDVEQIADKESQTARIRELYSLINRLGGLEKAVILLYLEEKSYREIADITGLSQTNVATKLNRIKEKLKKMSNS